MTKPWGWHLTLDVSGLFAEHVMDKTHLNEWVKSLVVAIDMVPFGEPQLLHFGHGDPELSGWTVLQFIETSNIMAHFNDNSCTAYIDVFSCKEFDSQDVIDHLLAWFGPQINYSTNFLVRKAP